MKTVSQTTITVTEINRSKFIAHLIPISEFDGIQQRLKGEHPKASHVIYAVRYLNEHEQIVENSTDDGEPKGCAGFPSLNVMRGEEMIECAVVTVRYFGGIKLGTGGMVRAYAQAVKNVISEAEILPYQKQEKHTFVTTYSSVEKVLYRLKKLGITQIDREFGVSDVSWSVVGDKESIDTFKVLFSV